MRKPGTLGSKKFGPGKLWVKKIWAQIFSSIFSHENLKVVGHSFPKIHDVRGPRTLCDGPKVPTRWKSVRVRTRTRTSEPTDLLNGVTARDACASKKNTFIQIWIKIYCDLIFQICHSCIAPG